MLRARRHSDASFWWEMVSVFHLFFRFFYITAPRWCVFDVHNFECVFFSILSKRHTGTLIFYMLIFDAFFRLLIAFFRSNFAFICRELVFQTTTWSVAKLSFLFIFPRFWVSFETIFPSSIHREVEIINEQGTLFFSSIFLRFFRFIWKTYMTLVQRIWHP